MAIPIYLLFFYLSIFEVKNENMGQRPIESLLDGLNK
jgi:hypothetical protein